MALADRLLDAPDVRHLHAHFAHGATTVTWLAAMITGLPFSFTAHAKDLYSESLNPAGLLRRKLAAARFVVTCTEANRASSERIEPPRRRPLRLPRPERRLLAAAGRGAGGRRAATARSACWASGRLVRKKGFDLLVEACGILRDRGVPFEATIVGEDGEHGAEIRRRIHARGLEPSISLAGPLGQAALFDEYRRATVFCLPCRVLDDGDRDGIPNVLVEAMACGLPVVTTGVSGIPELVHDGVNGLLVPPEDPAALADAIARLHRDPTLACRLAGAARGDRRRAVRRRRRTPAGLAALFSQARPMTRSARPGPGQAARGVSA